MGCAPGKPAAADADVAKAAESTSAATEPDPTDADGAGANEEPEEPDSGRPQLETEPRKQWGVATPPIELSDKEQADAAASPRTTDEDVDGKILNLASALKDDSAAAAEAADTTAEANKPDAPPTPPPEAEAEEPGETQEEKDEREFQERKKAYRADAKSRSGGVAKDTKKAKDDARAAGKVRPPAAGKADTGATSSVSRLKAEKATKKKEAQLAAIQEQRDDCTDSIKEALEAYMSTKEGKDEHNKVYVKLMSVKADRRKMRDVRFEGNKKVNSAFKIGEKTFPINKKKLTTLLKDLGIQTGKDGGIIVKGAMIAATLHREKEKKLAEKKEEADKKAKGKKGKVEPSSPKVEAIVSPSVQRGKKAPVKGKDEEMITHAEFKSWWMARSDVSDIFSFYDLDGSKTIDKSELRKLLKDLCIPAGESDLVTIYEKVDADQSGEIDFEEFFLWWTRDSRELQAQQQVKTYLLAGRSAFKGLTNSLVGSIDWAEAQSLIVGEAVDRAMKTMADREEEESRKNRPPRRDETPQHVRGARKLIDSNKLEEAGEKLAKAYEAEKKKIDVGQGDPKLMKAYSEEQKIIKILKEKEERFRPVYVMVHGINPADPQRRDRGPKDAIKNRSMFLEAYISKKGGAAARGTGSAVNNPNLVRTGFGVPLSAFDW